jgi:anti-repressor protein
MGKFGLLQKMFAILNYSNHKVAVSRFDDDEVRKVYLTDSLGRNQHTTIVNEA